MWWIDDPARYNQEVREMLWAFPAFSFRWDENQYGSWMGAIPSNFYADPVDDRFPLAYILRVDYTDGFPWEPPKAFIVDPEIPHSPHRWNDGSLCLFDPKDAYSFLSARSIVVQAVTWLCCQEMWEVEGGLDRFRQTGRYADTFDFWPAPQMRH